MSKTFYEDLLAKFKKANKERRLYVANKAGYKTVGGYQRFLERNIKAEDTLEVSKEVLEEVGTTDMLDMVVAFDTTGSMSSYIGSVKEHVKELIPNLFKNSPNLKMKIVAFGDYCDMPSSKTFGKAYQESPLTNDENELINFVQNTRNTAGGDSDEFYELVIKKITEETPWRDGKRAVLLIGDCTPHKVGYSYNNIVKNAQIDWKVEAKNAASLGIQFDTLTISDYYYSNWYKELSKITGGVSLPFKSSNKTSNIVEGLTYARSSKVAYTASMDTVMESGDEELIGAYKTMSTLLED